MPQNTAREVVIIGAGPAGLTAAYDLSKAAINSIVLEKDTSVGGISQTVKYKGFHFDIGGHRFFTKVKAVEEMWHEVLPRGDFLRRQRMSRIYFDKKFFHYPLRIVSTLHKMGWWNSFLALLSYLKAKARPQIPALTFEQYISNHFGKRLYETFFKSYTEKVWGIPCSEIRADWAAQRIKDLSIKTALKTAFMKSIFRHRAMDKAGVIKTLIDEFDYPRRGPGMMWEEVAKIVEERGGEIRLGTGVERIIWNKDRVEAVETETNGRRQLVGGTDFVSTMPLRELISKFDPPVPEEILLAAQTLAYRDFITVALIINKPDVFPDNWIYIHEPNVKLGRIQNFKNWSPEMVPDQEKTCLGLEYFCFEGDGLWTMPDEELKELGKQELIKIGLIVGHEVEDGAVVRMPKAYPVYDSVYRESLERIRGFLSGIVNLQTVGRNGMHKYNNQDHSMLTAMLAVKNIFGGKHDLWQVNVEQEYHEEVVSHQEASHEEGSRQLRLAASTQPLVPHRIGDASLKSASFKRASGG